MSDLIFKIFVTRFCATIINCCVALLYFLNFIQLLLRVQFDNQLLLDIFRNTLPFRIGKESTFHFNFIPIQPAEFWIFCTKLFPQHFCPHFPESPKFSYFLEEINVRSKEHKQGWSEIVQVRTSSSSALPGPCC